MIESPTRENILLSIPAGQWFSPSQVEPYLSCWLWLRMLVGCNYARNSDQAVLTRHSTKEFLFRWQVEKEEEPVNTATDITINWSNLTPAMRDELIATYIMRDSTTPLPRYTQSMDDAWKIVERITDATVTVTNVPGAYHHARIKPFAPQRAHHGFRLNAAEAICVAALRAAGLTVLHSEEDIINYHRDLAND